MIIGILISRRGADQGEISTVGGKDYRRLSMVEVLKTGEMDELGRELVEKDPDCPLLSEEPQNFLDRFTLGFSVETSRKTEAS